VASHTQTRQPDPLGPVSGIEIANRQRHTALQGQAAAVLVIGRGGYHPPTQPDHPDPYNALGCLHFRPLPRQGPALHPLPLQADGGDLDKD
jgi:hypothetical protein